MLRVWKLFLLLVALTMFKHVTSEFAIEYNALDMLPVSETEERSPNEVYRASDDDSKKSKTWSQTKLWVVVCSSISFCFLLCPFLIYLLCPNARICGCSPVGLHRRSN